MNFLFLLAVLLHPDALYCFNFNEAKNKFFGSNRNLFVENGQQIAPLNNKFGQENNVNVNPETTTQFSFINSTETAQSNSSDHSPKTTSDSTTFINAANKTAQNLPRVAFSKPTHHHNKHKVHTHIHTHSHGAHGHQTFHQTIHQSGISPDIGVHNSHIHSNVQQNGIIHNGAGFHQIHPSSVFQTGISGNGFGQHGSVVQTGITSSNGFGHGFTQIQPVSHGFHANPLNVQVSNINGNNNQVSQNQFVNSNSHGSLHNQPLISQDDIRSIWGKNANIDETFLLRNSENSKERANYLDPKTQNILDTLEERSYYQIRPDVIVDPYYSFEQNQYDYSSRKSDDNDERVEMPNIIWAPHLSWDRSKREIKNDVDKKLDEYKKLIENYKKNVTQKEELLFADYLNNLVDEFRHNDVIKQNNKRPKRATPIVKILSNPNAKIDVPKTLENVGAIIKNAFEDEKAPMYHARNLMGSTKNAVLSAMKIPPQNFIIPTKYEIKDVDANADPNTRVGAINRHLLSRSGSDNEEYAEESDNNNDPYGISATFTRIGNMVRDSVKSGQNTLTHINDVAHNARKVLHTTRRAIPRVILPHARKSLIVTSRFKEGPPTPSRKIQKTIVITPRILDIEEPRLGASKSEPNFLKVGHLLDVVGVSNPEAEHPELEKIVVKTRGRGGVKGIYIPPVGSLKRSRNLFPESTRNFVGNSNDLSSRKSARVSDLKNTLSKLNDELQESKQTMRLGSKIQYVEDSKQPVKSISKNEEKEIIQKFLKNIFKIDDNKLQSKSKYRVKLPNKKRESILKKSRPIKLGSRFKQDEKTTTVAPKSQPCTKKPDGYDITDEAINEIMKKIDDLNSKDCNSEDCQGSKNERLGSSNDAKKQAENCNDLPSTKAPVISSRFGQSQNIIKNDLLRQENTLTDSEDSNENSIRTNITRHWKLGDLIHVAEDEDPVPVKEAETNLPKLIQQENKLVPNDRKKRQNDEIFDQRSKIFSLNNAKQQEEIVGINLPPELMKPFMARASTNDIERMLQDNHDNFWNKNKVMSNLDDNEETVGINLPPELMKPFMARASNNEVEKMLRDNNDEDLWTDTVGISRHEIDHSVPLDNTSNDEILGITLPPELTKPFLPQVNEHDEVQRMGNDEFVNDLDQQQVNHDQPETVGTSMVIDEALRKPFMGMASGDQQNDFFNTFNDDIFHDDYTFQQGQDDYQNDF